MGQLAAHEHTVIKIKNICALERVQGPWILYQDRLQASSARSTSFTDRFFRQAGQFPLSAPLSLLLSDQDIATSAARQEESFPHDIHCRCTRRVMVFFLWSSIKRARGDPANLAEDFSAYQVLPGCRLHRRFQWRFHCGITKRIKTKKCHPRQFYDGQAETI